MRARISCRRCRRPSAFGVAAEPVRQQRKARADVADHLRVGKVDLLHIGRREADVDDLRPARPHDEGRLLHRVVTDRDDQVGLVDRLVNVVPLRQRGGGQYLLGYEMSIHRKL